MRRVIWPGALPSILAGFRITASVALLLVVSAEMIGAQFGIGAFVLQAGNLMQTDQLLAGVVILSLFGLAVGKLINVLEARLRCVTVRRCRPRRHCRVGKAEACPHVDLLRARWARRFARFDSRDFVADLTHSRDLRGTDRASAARDGRRSRTAPRRYRPRA